MLCLEEAEERMAALDFSTAAGVLERVLGRQATFRFDQLFTSVQRTELGNVDSRYQQE